MIEADAEKTSTMVPDLNHVAIFGILSDLGDIARVNPWMSGLNTVRFPMPQMHGGAGPFR